VADQRALDLGGAEMRWPETLSTSSMRPVIQKLPSSSRRAPSPAKYIVLKSPQ
jgi:hypothetical protein